MGQRSFKFYSLSLVLVSCISSAQTISHAYNRDTNEPFQLKGVTSKGVVKGPIYKEETVFQFDNPFKKLTEASVWLDLPEAAVLSQFGYWYKREYVPGVLMDKNKAWFIYTAITSRNEDPGIMVQTDPSSYHTQIFPLATGYDFRLKLNSVGFLQPEGENFAVPQPGTDTGVYPVQVDSAHPETLLHANQKDGVERTIVSYPRRANMDMQVYAQRFKDGYTYVAGILRTDKPDAHLALTGIHKVYWARPEDSGDGSVKFFVGRRKGKGTMTIRTKGEGSDFAVAKYIKANERGADAAKLWAHQKLIQDQDQSGREVLALSLKYQVPSAETALLAVPKEEMKIYKAKAAEYRRHQAEEARRERSWQSQRSSNWSSSPGGDPEIRVYQPDAKRVYAVLPDGRSFDLTKDSKGYWGGNYDIPADAPEGNYSVRVNAVDKDGNETTQNVNYQVDRTAPTGTLKIEDGFLVLTSEAGLARAIAVFSDGSEEPMLEITSGVYKIPVGIKRVVKVELIDQAHNVAEVPWSN